MKNLLMKFLDRFDKYLLGGLTFVVFAILAFVYWLFDPYQKIPLWAFVPVIIIAYVICLIIYAVYSVLLEREKEGKDTLLKLQRYRIQANVLTQ